jgi:copper(I)-binding protein
MLTLRLLRPLVPLVLILGLGSVSVAADSGGVVIKQAWARATAGSASTGVVYLTLEAKPQANDRLLAVATPAADEAELHIAFTENGVAKMRPVSAVDVNDGAPIVMKPGGLHIMLMGLKAPLKEGQSFPLTLTFEKAGAVETSVAVRGAGAGAPGDAKPASGG